MDYVVGSVAALISGNVTPNRPKRLKRALTPTKHQPSPNVTPKSEFVEDRSIFLSPTLQKKKAVVKKSPKRIFENPELDGEDNSTITSPKADKVKKHLKDELEAESITNTSVGRQNSPKVSKDRLNKHSQLNSPKKKLQMVDEENVQETNTPKKKKKRNSVSESTEMVKSDDKENVTAEESQPEINVSNDKSPKKKKRKSVISISENIEVESIESSLVTPDTAADSNDQSPNKKKRNKHLKLESGNTEKSSTDAVNTDDQKSIEGAIETGDQLKSKKKNKKRKKKSKSLKKQTEKRKTLTDQVVLQETKESTDNQETKSAKKKQKRNSVNLNAITTKDSESEHESDDEIESDTEQANNEIIAAAPMEESSDDEEPEEQKKPEKKKPKEADTEDEIRRTLFVGNVLFNNKCKKEIKKIFNKYGDIETVRIRTVPVKDARVTPKLAVIKHELHPDRSTVNIYVKFKAVASIDKALVENNTVLNGHHLRVSRSDTTGVAHDARCAVFLGNLPFAIEDETLRGKFEKCGEIESVRVIRDKKTNAGKGFGYVNFVSKDAVELALALSEEDLTVKNRIIRVQRCSQSTQKHTDKNNKMENNKGSNQGVNGSDYQGRNQRGGFQRGSQRGGFRGGSQRGGFEGGSQRGGFRGGSQRGGFQRGGQRGGFQRGSQRGGFRGGSQRGGFRDGSLRDGFHGRDQGGDVQNKNEGFARQEQNTEGDGAYRRIMKRKNQEGGDGPPSKVANTNQPKEKKTRQEFVGVTAEKKKKHKIDKGQKKKKALSEILTK